MADTRPYDIVTLKTRVQTYTVDRLKALIQGLNDTCGANLSRTGKKQELVQKILDQLNLWESSNVAVSLSGARDVMDHIDENGSYDPAKVVKHMRPPPVVMQRATTSTSSPAAARSINGAGPSSTGSLPTPAKPGLPFKSSPYYHIEQHVSDVQVCPESANLHDRKSVFLEFKINADHRAKLQDGNHQLRLYCTSSAFYIAPTAFRPNPPQNPYPVEFPNTCELRLNGAGLQANTRGLKKKPGTAPPAHLGNAVRTGVGESNRIEMVYCNNQQQGQPLQPNKKYYIQVNLVSVTTVEQLVDKLKKGKYRSKESILAKMRENNRAEDDIEIGPQKMSLKCPLSYTRIITPSRAALCVHPQCFDAYSWFSMMEQTTTWLCPVCEKVLPVGDLIVDGFFDEILQSTPDSVEDVIVEANGAWHTSDNKYHSADWTPPKASSSKSAPKPITSSPAYAAKKEESPSQPFSNGGGRPHSKAVEVFELSDDDDDDAGPVPTRVSSTISRPSVPLTQRRVTGLSDVIDLTLSDDDEPFFPPPTTASTSGKRKDRSPTATSSTFSNLSEQNKRARMDGDSQGSRSDDTYGGNDRVRSSSSSGGMSNGMGSNNGIAGSRGYIPHLNGVRNPYDLPPLQSHPPQPHHDLSSQSRHSIRLPPLSFTVPNNSFRATDSPNPQSPRYYNSRGTPPASRPPPAPGYGRPW